MCGLCPLSVMIQHPPSLLAPLPSPPVRLMAPDSLQVAQEGSHRCNITWNVPQSSHYIERHLEFEVRTRSLDHSWEVSTGPSPTCPDPYAAHPVPPPAPKRHDSPRQPCLSSVLPAPTPYPPSLPPVVLTTQGSSGGWQAPGWH